ncbi:uroplakin-3b-like [Excalfactoria chinensis]|uniref:uroplakin-3b-like n=1 Tax=Excalfactoria chinensis TaxID=46218 RepID=UPI003B3A7E3E
MELLWVLLALAGMDAAAGLGESLWGPLLPYVPRVATGTMLGKVTATTFVLERPRCIFDPLANASDAVWLAVAYADASTAFKNPTSSSEVPPYEGLPTARAYMTLETAAAAYGCSAPGTATLRVGGDTTCHGRAPCNGPLPSAGPYRVKFLLMGCSGPKAETKWSEPILLRRARSLSTIDPTPARRGSTAVIIAAILASLGAALAVAMLGAVGTQLCVPLCHRDLGAHLPYRTHHVPPALPHTLPPACICGCTPWPRGP